MTPRVGQTGVTRQLAGFCAELSYGDIPEEVIESTVMLAFDTIGVAAGGTAAESSRTMLKFMKALERPGNGTVIAGRQRVAPEYAALLNGAFAHALDFDDLCNEASAHPGAAVIPAVLAAGDMTGGDGKDFLLAVVVGYEVMCRLGKAINPARHYARGFHPTGTCGTFGAAAAAGKILGLNAEQMTSALGIAGSQAAGCMEFLAQGAWTKRMHPGWAAHSGIIAAMLAREGYRGPSTIIEGKSGFLNSYSYDTNANEVLDNIGEVFYAARTSVKPYSACRYKHGPIDGIRKIMQENGLRPGDVSEIIIGLLEVAYPIIVEPAELKYNPQSVVDAQFSMPFGAAVAVLYGNALPDQYTDEIIKSAAVAEVMKKVRIKKDPELERLYPRQWPSTVEIRTRGGGSYQTFVAYPKGDPENPLSWDELREKFNSVTSGVYAPERQSRIADEMKKLSRSRKLDAFKSLVGARDLG
jgi:2-methylcitrate dehydratase PrpD